MLSFTCNLLALVIKYLYHSACKTIRRRQEPPFDTTIYVREFCNTVCTAPFIVISVLRIATCSREVAGAYMLMLLLGFIILWNHAVYAHDLLFEYVPMAIFVYVNYVNGMFSEVDIISIWYFLLAFTLLVIDYVKNYGFLHSMWHILIASAFDVIFSEKMNSKNLVSCKPQYL